MCGPRKRTRCRWAVTRMPEREYRNPFREILSGVEEPNPWDLTRKFPDEYEEWQTQVYNGDTLRGFADWLTARQEESDA